jgi:Eukaryotic cytochrome b561
MQLLQTIFNWLLAPLSGASVHDIAPLVAWHARLMVLAWSVLIPLGVLVARFYKVTPKQDFPVRLDNPFWWHAHRGLQYTGVFLSLVAVGLIWRKSANADAYGLHQLFGYALLILGFLQIIGAQFRGSKGGPTDVAKGLPLRGDHFDMTRRRRIFEGWHKSARRRHDNAWPCIGRCAALDGAGDCGVVATAAGCVCYFAKTWPCRRYLRRHLGQVLQG